MALWALAPWGDRTRPSPHQSRAFAFRPGLGIERAAHGLLLDGAGERRAIHSPESDRQTPVGLSSGFSKTNQKQADRPAG